VIASVRIGLVAVSLALVAAVPGVAVGARAGKVTVPTIHETFTVLPCTGAPAQRSTLEQEGCAEHQILATDKQIDGLNGEIVARVGNHAAQQRFVAGHRAWLTYRRAFCLSRADVLRGGTESAVIDATCSVELNRRHIVDLRHFLSDLTAE
jgi:uncharacterized protein YecT (DUF1311 family)